MSMVRKSYWYRFYYGECPVCGDNKGFKERVYTESKPNEVEKRHIYMTPIQTYDFCLEL